MIEYGHVAMTRLTTEQWKEANQIKAERERKKEVAEKGGSLEITPVSGPVVEKVKVNGKMRH